MSERAVFLEPLEIDALTELVNIGVSRAAASLRQMVGAQVYLSFPSVQLVTRGEAADLMRQREAGPLVAVRQGFEGAFSGRAMLIFPEANSLELVHAVTGDELSPREAADMESEALSETGNVVLNGCLATMANLLQKSLMMSLPEVVRGEGADLFEGEDLEPGEGVVLFLYINFAINDRNVRGYIAVLMDLVSLDALKSLVKAFVDRVAGPDVAKAS